ncbi:MAG: phosphodiester glycosidase family protein [Chloroflexi bacterium]|nr:phosphodiester glycosidase family protein [Chloroflexota bacterium]MCL5273409.1 phosphodiester glycosidase family protein [Chloroflexota bacterium]
MSRKTSLNHKQAGRIQLRRAGLIRRVWFVLLALLAAIAAVSIALPAASPEAGAYIADSLRAVVGPQPVAMLESAVFQIQDAINRTRYSVTRDGGQIMWTSSAAPAPKVTFYPTAAIPASAPVRSAAAGPKLSRPAAPTASVTATPIPLASPRPTAEPNVVEAAPMVGADWQSFGPASPDQTPIMARTAVKPDPTRPFANAAVVRIDLHQARLHLVPGTLEPTFAKGIPQFKRPGAIPISDAVPGVLLAAFNGGFKAEHGHFGMMVDGKVILPPIDGIATLGFYRDGSVRMGAWGQDISQTSDLVSYRQNCPLLVERGVVNPNINIADVLSWGYTGGNPAATWRSGLGLSQDGRFLIYVAGNSLTAQTLGNALQQAGAYIGMQLDINGFYTRFYTYEPANAAANTNSLKAVRLLQAMSGAASQYLIPYSRDFFYLTTRATPNMNAATQPWLALHKSK